MKMPPSEGSTVRRCEAGGGSAGTAATRIPNSLSLKCARVGHSVECKCNVCTGALAPPLSDDLFPIDWLVGAGAPSSPGRHARTRARAVLGQKRPASARCGTGRSRGRWRWSHTAGHILSSPVAAVVGVVVCW